MAKIPQPQHTTINAINRVHEQRHAEEKPRGHMGVSQLGKPDERELWLSFRHAFQPFIPGRVLRLFRRGHREEDTVVSDLKEAGMDVRDTGKNQRTLRFGSHVAGSCDGVIMSGVPEAPSKPHVLEAKTISKSRFAQLQKQGLEKSNYVYFVQINCYMHGTGIDRALLIAICKDTDEIYTERVRYDKELAERYIQRGQRIALADRMPEPLTPDPTDWRMKFSPYYAAYWPESASAEHWRRLIPQRESSDPLLARICVNWRTDATSTPRADSTWYSERHQSVIPPEWQHTSDEGHVLHPSLMSLAGWQLLDGPEEFTARYKLPDGQEVLNGAPRHNVYTSEELLSDPQACAAMNDDETAQKMRIEMGARIQAEGLSC